MSSKGLVNWVKKGRTLREREIKRVIIVRIQTLDAHQQRDTVMHNTITLVEKTRDTQPTVGTQSRW